MPNKNASLDVVIFGATGFTGALIAEYFANTYGADGDVRWAVAGRNADKLKKLRSDLGMPDTLPIITADADDADALLALASSTRIVIAAAGPFQLYGSKLVAACAQAGCDYIDLCGEPVWIREMIDAHAAVAESSGARLVFSSAFDSVPSDLGVLLVQTRAIEKFGKPVQRVKGRVTALQGGPSGGTVASMKTSFAAAASNPDVANLARSPYALVPGFNGPRQPSGSKPVYDEDLDSWAAPFIMAVINTKTVHRTNALLGFRYGEDFLYDEMTATGPGEKGEAIAGKIAASGGAFGDPSAAPRPGEGPSREERENGHFTMIFHGQADAGQSITVSVSGDQDPGYGSTSKMISESALCLIDDASDVPGGAWTPAAAMGHKLVERLQEKGVLKFAIMESD